MQALIKIKAVVLSQESQSSSPESEGSQQFADENQKSENFEESPEAKIDDKPEESKGGIKEKTFPCTFVGCTKILGRKNRLEKHM